MSARRRAPRTAFTLAEVLATVVLIGIVLPVVMRGISGGLQAAERARGMAQAASLGEARLAELVVTGEWATATGAGDFSPHWPQYRWSLLAQSHDFGATELLLRVFWLERGAEQSVTVSTLVYESALTQEVLP